MRIATYTAAQRRSVARTTPCEPISRNQGKAQFATEREHRRIVLEHVARTARRRRGAAHRRRSPARATADAMPLRSLRTSTENSPFALSGSAAIRETPASSLPSKSANASRGRSRSGSNGREALPEACAAARGSAGDVLGRQPREEPLDRRCVFRAHGAQDAFADRRDRQTAARGPRG